MDAKSRIEQLQARRERREEQLQAAKERAAVAVQLGAEAEATLASPAIQRAFAELEKAYTAKWRDSGPEDIDDREDAWHQLRALGMVKAHLETTVKAGRVASSTA